MVNYRALLDMDFPTSSGVYGLQATWVGPLGIPRIAQNISGSGDKWSNGGQIVGQLTTGDYVEASITYVYSISGLSAGWYFSYHLNANAYYQALNHDPTSRSLGITLKKVGSSWSAVYNNWSDNETYTKSIPSSPNANLTTSGGVANWLMHETAYQSSCTYYNQFIDIDFNNFKYLDSSGNPTSQNPTVSGGIIDTPIDQCLLLDKPNMKIYHK